MATYAIGDIQGCFKQFQQLLQTLNFDPKKDKLWLTGDLVNRGSHSLDVLRYLKNLENPPVIVLGNHDLHLLAVASGKAMQKPGDTLSEILQAADCEELCIWLRAQKLLHHCPHTQYTLVHAGLPPQWDLALAQQCAREFETILQSPDYADFFSHMYGNFPTHWNDSLSGWERLRFIANAFTRIRFCTETGDLDLMSKEGLDKQPTGYLPWFKIPERKSKNLKILFGHWAALQGNINEPNVFALDGGCVWGNRMIAMRLEDNERFSVSCNKANITHI